MEKAKIVIVGAGFGGLKAAKELAKEPVDVTLVDRLNHHLFQPLLYQVATGALSPGDIAVPFRNILAKQENIRCLVGEVVTINKEKKEIVLENGDTLPFDYLILAPGARHSYFGNDSWEEFAPGLKTIRDALKMREKIVSSFEKAERSQDPQVIKRLLTFIVIGAGPTGVELAGALAEIALETVPKSYRSIDTKASRIILLEAANRILPSFSEYLSEKALLALQEDGVEVLTKTPVIEVTKEGVKTPNTFFPAATVFWSAGCQASPLLKSLNCPLDRQGRVIVEKDLSIPSSPEIFVIGDAAHVKGKNDLPLPGVAQVAIQGGAFVATLIKQRLRGKKERSFSYNDRGTMATIGKGKAIAQVGKHEFSGFFAWVAWCFIHILFLIGFRNRISVFVRWSALFLAATRDVMLLTRPLSWKKENGKP